MKVTYPTQANSNPSPSTRSGKRFSMRSLTLVLIISLSVAGLATKASAQTCLEQCQQALASCLQAAQGDPLLEVRCQNDYDRCGQDCM